MPPFYTPGDGRVVRQGTSLLYIAGEKTRASAPWGHQNHRLRRPVIFCLHCVQKAFMFIRYLYGGSFDPSQFGGGDFDPSQFGGMPGGGGGFPGGGNFSGGEFPGGSFNSGYRSEIWIWTAACAAALIMAVLIICKVRSHNN